MNITLVSYHQSLDFGIVACRRSLPQIQRMIDHLEEALTELEEVAGLAKPARKRRSNSTSKKATAGGKAKARSKKGAAAANKPNAKAPVAKKIRKSRGKTA